MVGVHCAVRECMEWKASIATATATTNYLRWNGLQPPWSFASLPSSLKHLPLNRSTFPLAKRGGSVNCMKWWTPSIPSSFISPTKLVLVRWLFALVSAKYVRKSSCESMHWKRYPCWVNFGMEIPFKSSIAAVSRGTHPKCPSFVLPNKRSKFSLHAWGCQIAPLKPCKKNNGGNRERGEISVLY